MELKAQLSHVYAFADASIEKASTEHLRASGALIQITALGGREIIPPVVIKDGLSPETIACLRRDLVRSFELATAFKPKKEV
jgi:hypothetical protein